MSYNPVIDAPRNQAELEICVNHYEAKEQAKAKANPAYMPKTRADLTRMYSIFLQPAPESEPAPTTEELFAQLRSYREVKLREYDEKISQLDRQIRLNPDYAAYPIERAEWDAYAVALCNLPAQEGAPWDGGGSETPWPQKPA